MRHWLRQFRKIKGFTQQEVATIAGISRSCYAGIEQGNRNPNGRSAKLISETLGFDVGLFFAEIGLKTSQESNKSA